jgi:hypothetical protein
MKAQCALSPLWKFTMEFLGHDTGVFFHDEVFRALVKTVEVKGGNGLEIQGR